MTAISALPYHTMISRTVHWTEQVSNIAHSGCRVSHKCATMQIWKNRGASLHAQGVQCSKSVAPGGMTPWDSEASARAAAPEMSCSSRRLPPAVPQPESCLQMHGLHCSPMYCQPAETWLSDQYDELVPVLELKQQLRIIAVSIHVYKRIHMCAHWIVTQGGPCARIC